MMARTREAGRDTARDRPGPRNDASPGSSRGRNRRSRRRGGRSGDAGGAGSASGSDGGPRNASGSGGKGGSGGGGNRGGGGGKGTSGGGRGSSGGGGGKRRSQPSNRRGRNRRPDQQQDMTSFWGEASELPEPKTDVRITDDPDAVPRSLGTPPLPGQEAIAGHYFAAVYDRAVSTAGALAAAGGLIDPDALTDDEED